MKPKNFPGRKNKRRMSALKRLQKFPEETFAYKKEFSALQNTIIPQEQARNIKTKKWRGK
jgi:hypothetical protein